MKTNSYASLIRQIRSMNQWSQNQMAAALGIEQATVSRLENGEWEPSKPVRMLIDALQEKGAA